MNLITPLILIIISIGTFFMYIDPNYRGTDLANGAQSIQTLQRQDAEYKKALDDAIAVRETRNGLQAKMNNFKPDDITKLEKLLPDNIDNIKLVIDMNNIADSHKLILKNIQLDTAVSTTPGQLSTDNNKYGTVGITFSVTASYNNFLNFLEDLEQSQRLVEITDLSVTSNNTGLYDFSVGLKTYWLK